MSLQIFPTNIGGVSLNGALGPLSSLFSNGSVHNLVYPSDLASNPAMGHAVQFSVYEYTTGFADNSITQGLIGSATNLIGATSNLVGKALTGLSTGSATNFTSYAQQLTGQAFSSFSSAANSFSISGLPSLSQIGTAVGNATPAAAQLFQAKSYQPVHKGAPLANISLFMPEGLVADYTSHYEEISMTKEMNLRGRIGNAFGDLISQNPNNATALGVNPMASTYGKAITSELLGKLTGAGDVAMQAAGVVSNPQTQLLYRSISLRTFNLDFIMTPKNSQEAKTVKDICDTFTFYSLPGIAGAQVGIPGQYLTPPQIFSIKFKFLGQNGVAGSLTNIFNSALSNIGLGFLTQNDPTGTITNGAAAKIMTINDCVLESVQVDYAPNGWAAYNDGYPIQTRLSLTFKETQMLTKQHFSGSAIEDNYVNYLNNGIAHSLGYEDIASLNDASDPTSSNFIGI
jgi:hypothetical protein